jgi:hypothetical protein
MPLEVWKYPLGTAFGEGDVVPVFMPEGRVLSLQWQHGTLCIWAAVDPASARSPRKFAFFKSGRQLHGIDANKYIGTVQTMGASPVWHVFEV